jgi:uncharacterized protein (UPF0333 family)
MLEFIILIIIIILIVIGVSYLISQTTSKMRNNYSNSSNSGINEDEQFLNDNDQINNTGLRHQSLVSQNQNQAEIDRI